MFKYFKNKSILITGGTGSFGGAFVRFLLKKNIPLKKIIIFSRDELKQHDLYNEIGNKYDRILRFFLGDVRDLQRLKSAFLDVDIIIHAAALKQVPAAEYNPIEFIRTNVLGSENVIEAAFRNGVKKLLFLGSSCIYPRLAQQPMREDALLTGLLEPTNEPYAIAKIAGIKLCESYNRQYGQSHGVDYRSVMPTNLYGPGDNYDLQNSHVLPALIRKAHEAKLRGDTEYVVWGSGNPMREFLYVDDLADACVQLMTAGYCGPLLNIGTGVDVTIRELAEQVMQAVGFEGRIVFDSSKPDGTPRKLLDNARIAALGWQPKVDLEAGLRLTMDHYLSTPGQGRR
jgi:GDP-L-fucose synthase